MSGEKLRSVVLEDGTIISYVLDCKPRKNMYISIREGVLILKIPPAMPISRGEDFIREKSGWILKNLSAKKSTTGVPEVFFNGMKFSMADGEYVVETRESEKYFPPVFSPGKLIVSVRNASDEEYINARCQKAVAEKAVEIIRERAEILTEKTGLYPEKITVKRLCASWGRCSSTKNISINLNIAFYPMECVDYVIIHELCHLKHMDHSSKFWELVDRYCPDRKRIRSIIR